MTLVKEKERLISHLEKSFLALSNETRMDILRVIFENEEVALIDLCCDFRLSKTAMIYHLRCLKEAGLIYASSHRNKKKYYAINLKRLNALMPQMYQLYGANSLEFSKTTN